MSYQRPRPPAGSDALWHLSTLCDERRPEGSGGGPHLEDRIDRLALICMAMWSLIRSETNLTEEQLLERVREIDLMDGEEDGKITRQVTQCSRCNRPMSSRHTRCIYCGSDALVASAFDTV